MEGMKGALLAMGMMIGVMVFVGGAMGAQHVVGGNQGWDESTDLNSWASSETFKVGDQLVFKYAQGLHSVVELADENGYKSCDTSTAVNSMSSGNDVVKLTKPGTRYFACGTSGHCSQGMKLKVTVAADGAPSTPASTSSSPTTSLSSSSSKTSNSGPGSDYGPGSGCHPGKSLSTRASAPRFLLAAGLIAPFMLRFSGVC